ncbi:MAG: LytTR family transcriptional regulator DNA-binding domain-containing protein [Candidatus Ornithomonoglobus sp.]
MTIVSNRRKIILGISAILYVLVTNKNAEIHVSERKIYETREPLCELEDKLGDGFIKVGCIVSAMAVHDITDKINLSNGEAL